MNDELEADFKENIDSCQVEIDRCIKSAVWWGRIRLPLACMVATLFLALACWSFYALHIGWGVFDSLEALGYSALAWHQCSDWIEMNRKYKKEYASLKIEAQTALKDFQRHFGERGF